MRRLALIIVAVVTFASPAGAVSTLYNFTLGPEAPGATGSGSGTVVYDDVLHSLSINTSWSGLSGFTSVAHIHCCTTNPGSGTVGVAVTPSTLPGFPTNVQSGVYSILLDLTQAATYTGAFLTGGGGTPAGAEAALFAGMNAGKAYFNIHSNLFPGGEIRGFLAVPEPGLVLLVAAGCAAISIARRRGRAE